MSKICAVDDLGSSASPSSWRTNGERGLPVIGLRYHAGLAVKAGARAFARACERAEDARP
jgi:hypothetical protein